MTRHSLLFCSLIGLKLRGGTNRKSYSNIIRNLHGDMNSRDLYIVTCISIARQRVGKHIPSTQAHKTIGRLLPDNGPVNTHSWQQETVFYVGSAQSVYKKCSAGQKYDKI
jgi:hypothetical protein